MKTLTRVALHCARIMAPLAVVGLLVNGFTTRETGVLYWLLTYLAISVAVVIVLITSLELRSPTKDIFSGVKGKDITNTHLDQYRRTSETKDQI